MLGRGVSLQGSCARGSVPRLGCTAVLLCGGDRLAMCWGPMRASADLAALEGCTGLRHGLAGAASAAGLAWRPAPLRPFPLHLPAPVLDLGACGAVPAGEPLPCHRRPSVGCLECVSRHWRVSARQTCPCRHTRCSTLSGGQCLPACPPLMHPTLLHGCWTWRQASLKGTCEQAAVHEVQVVHLV